MTRVSDLLNGDVTERAALIANAITSIYPGVDVAPGSTFYEFVIHKAAVVFTQQQEAMLAEIGNVSLTSILDSGAISDYDKVADILASFGVTDLDTGSIASGQAILYFTDDETVVVPTTLLITLNDLNYGLASETDITFQPSTSTSDNKLVARGEYYAAIINIAAITTGASYNVGVAAEATINLSLDNLDSVFIDSCSGGTDGASVATVRELIVDRCSYGSLISAAAARAILRRELGSDTVYTSVVDPTGPMVCRIVDTDETYEKTTTAVTYELVGANTYSVTMSNPSGVLAVTAVSVNGTPGSVASFSTSWSDINNAIGSDTQTVTITIQTSEVPTSIEVSYLGQSCVSPAQTVFDDDTYLPIGAEWVACPMLPILVSLKATVTTATGLSDAQKAAVVTSIVNSIKTRGADSVQQQLDMSEILSDVQAATGISLATVSVPLFSVTYVTDSGEIKTGSSARAITKSISVSNGVTQDSAAFTSDESRITLLWV